MASWKAHVELMKKVNETLTIKIPGTEKRVDEDNNNFTVYRIKVQSSRFDDRAWTVFRRYSEFASLDQKLKKRYPKEASYPALPGKKVVGNMAENFVHQRQAQLELYLTTLLEIPGITWTVEIRNFLDDATMCDWWRRQLAESVEEKESLNTAMFELNLKLSQRSDELTDIKEKTRSNDSKDDDKSGTGKELGHKGSGRGIVQFFKDAIVSEPSSEKPSQKKVVENLKARISALEKQNDELRMEIETSKSNYGGPRPDAEQRVDNYMRKCRQELADVQEKITKLQEPLQQALTKIASGSSASADLANGASLAKEVAYSLQIVRRQVEAGATEINMLASQIHSLEGRLSLARRELALKDGALREVMKESTRDLAQPNSNNNGGSSSTGSASNEPVINALQKDNEMKTETIKRLEEEVDNLRSQLRSDLSKSVKRPSSA